ncbi:MAG: FAD-dependent oxidoreductase [Clostridia bacterium]|nr:FAD-dependent oxidoreductase [Clostridia bacterium]MBN2882585.1 FAD-dependent oxidoreductase [Clostridia bacterium]
MSKKVLIVGGVAGGASCAARLRRLDEKAEIILFERGEFISFANCGLPYHIGGVIKDRDELLLQTPESFYARFNVDVRIYNEVIDIDRANKIVKVIDRAKGSEYMESYDVLVLSTGSSPMKPPIPGIDNEGIFQLWNIPDMDRIIEFMNKKTVRKAVVVGGGFIGIEMAENLIDRDIEVTLVEMLNQVMAPIDFDMAQILHSHMTEKGLRLVLEDGVSEFKQKNESIIVKTKSGKEIAADMVVLAIGVVPNSQLLKASNLPMNRRGGAIIDEYLRTEDENIYAVGDMVEVVHFVNGEKRMIPLAGPANKMGRMAADNICGMNRKYNGSQGTGVVKVFDMTSASVGLNEKDLKNAGKEIRKDYRVTVIHPGSHAGYYPGASTITLKLIFDLNGKILGAQAVGYEGVEKRIDVIATAQRLGATIYDLEELELNYAPSFSSAKDPVNMAGYTAENILSGTIDNITCDQLADYRDAVILDVRTPEEVSMGAVPGYLNIPVDSLRDRIQEVPVGRPVVVYCRVGIRAYIACRILMQNGFNEVYNLAGGYVSYSTINSDFTFKG